ncbi:MAG: hypothetical protein IPO91_27890 [Chloroflexi bacterium]|nr:hypothetical protein [Chloroflexota bacterium]
MPASQRGRTQTLILLFVLSASLYLTTYSAHVESGDARRLLDTVSSVVDYGDYLLDLSAWQFPPENFDAAHRLPLQSGNVEPLQVLAAAPLYALAKLTPLGLVHTVYLLNVIIGALAVCVLYSYARTLGYRERTSILAAVVFAACTVLWVYSKTFFREPLMLLLLLTSAYLIERLRLRSYRSLPLAAALFLALMGLVLTKASAVLAVPALLILALPPLHGVPWRRLLVAGGVTLALLTVIFTALTLFGEVLGAGSRFNLLRILGEGTPRYFLTALHTYLLSPGGSVWGTSPVVLLALPGMMVLLRRGQVRYPVAISGLLLSFALAYAWLNGVHWFGGLSFPPRFLIQVIPFLLIGALPILEQLAEGRSVWWWVAAPLMLYGLWIQITGASLRLDAYVDLLPPEADRLIEWGGGLNVVQYLRPVMIPQLWGVYPADIAWTQIERPIYVGLFALMVIGAGFFIWRRSRGWPVLPAAFVVVLGVGLVDLYGADARYRAFDQSLVAALPLLETETDPGDVILLSSPRYETFFVNAGKLWNAGRVIGLPLQPGERPSEEQPAQIVADNPAALLTSQTIRLLHNLALTHDRLWLLEDGSPDIWWSARPVERFLSAHYYPVQYWRLGDFTWLVEYSTVSAPDQYAYRAPEATTELVFGETLHLRAYELPAGDTYTPGSVLPISLYWQTDVPITGNYTVAFFVRDVNGAPIAQLDLAPGGGFRPTSTWIPDAPVWDNRAVELPADLPAGEYQLWVKVYEFTDAAHDLPVTSGEALDGVIGVLPVRIQVR